VASVRESIGRHPFRWATAAVVVLGAIGFGLYWFAPWNLVIDRRVDDALPSVAAAGAEEGGVDSDDAGAGDEGPTDAPTPGEEPDDGGRVELFRGDFHDLEHATAGAAVVIELEDGSRFLRLEDLDTSNGPDLRVVLTDQPLSSDWHVWDDGELVDLGALRGNLGSSNYEIPEGLDLSRFETAVIWCRRFSVGFGVAPLRAA
jgi:hypothetical protein